MILIYYAMLQGAIIHANKTNKNKITAPKPITEKTNSEKSDAEFMLTDFPEKARYTRKAATRK
tara:strand:+ start:295 stop:483 length:189 start_codon:yes stop_codon:yes gene_type:complete